MLSFLRVCKIDIFSLNPVDDISYIEKVDQIGSKSQVYKSHLKSLFTSSFSFVKIPEKDILFYGTSINNQRSFIFVLNKLRHSFINIKSNDEYGINSYIFWSVFFIIPFAVSFFKADNSNRSKIKKYPAKYLLTYGKYYVALKLLKKIKPKLLVLANDHSNMNRCLLANALLLGVKTAYIQHASVSKEFPRLAFDYSFLDGEESFDAYGRTSKKGSVVILCGPCRYDYMGAYNPFTDNYVGLSINELDDFEIVKNVCRELRKAGCDKIKVRPHPSMGRWHEDWFKLNEIDFSVPGEESPAEYLCSLKMQISNVSGIHLDAVMLGIPSFYFQLSNTQFEDIFGFIKAGLVSKIEKIQTLKEVILNPERYLPNTKSVRYHIASYKTELNFNVGAFIADIIDPLLDSDFNNQYIEKVKPAEIECFNF